jgi:two-component system, NtrC family, response regulator
MIIIFTDIKVDDMTGYSSLDTAIEAMSLGASDYFIKPFSSKSIFSSIDSYLVNNKTGGNEKLTQYFETKVNALPGKNL